MFLPGGGDLIFYIVGTESFVDGMHDFVALVTASSSIEAGHDHILCAGPVCGPSRPEPKIWLLTAGPRVSTDELRFVIKPRFVMVL